MEDQPTLGYPLISEELRDNGEGDIHGSLNLWRQ